MDKMCKWLTNDKLYTENTANFPFRIQENKFEEIFPNLVSINHKYSRSMQIQGKDHSFDDKYSWAWHINIRK